MTDDFRSVLREMGVVLHAVTEQAFHAHWLAEQAYLAAIGHKPPADEHIQHSKSEVLTLLAEAMRKLE